MKIQILGAIIALFVAEAFVTLMLTIERLGIFEYFLSVIILAFIALIGGKVASIYLED
jgi:hypothetical protein